MKHLLLIATFCLVATMQGICRVGMGENNFSTPGGHIICDCDPYDQTPVLVGHEDKIHKIEKFYFYKNHIIGYGPDYFFIFNEVTNQADLFGVESQWQQSITAKNLKPVLYTNWLNVTDSPETFLLITYFWSMMASPLLLPILMIAAVQLLRRKIVVSGRFLFRAFSVMVILALLAGSQVNIYSW